MYTILSFAVVGLLIGFCVASGTLVERFGAYCGSSIFAAAFGVVAALLLSPLVPQHEVVYGPATLVSMRSSDNNLSGAFIFGTGGFRGQTTYNFMIKLQDGSMTPDSVYADSKVRLIEDSTLTNVGYWSTVKNEPMKDSPLYDWSIGHSENVQIVRQEFRIPAGTVVQNFNIQ